MSIIEINFRLQCATFCSLEILSFATRTLKMLKKNVFHTENSIYMGVPIDVLNVNFSKIKSNSKYAQELSLEIFDKQLKSLKF